MRTSLSLKAQRTGDLWVVVATGIISVHSVTDATATLDRLFRQADARAAVLDMRRALVVLDGEDWVKVAQPATSADVPVAFVVTEVELAAMRLHCTRMHASGFFRVAVTDFAQGLAWGRECLAHWRHAPLPTVGAERAAASQPQSLHQLQRPLPATPSPEALGL